VPKEYFIDGMHPDVDRSVRDAVRHLESLGAIPVEISLPHTGYAVAVYYILATSEASSNLGRYDGVRYGYRAKGRDLIDMYMKTRSEGFGSEVKRRIMLGTYALSAGYYEAYYRKAQQVRRLLAEEFLAAFSGVDVIVTPASPIPPFKLGEKTGDPLAMYLADIYTVTASLAGICGLSVPCGSTPGGLPVGMQILASHFNEGMAFRAACAVEAAQQ
jgi:aspartyl-tRNA(Asn)/glutamyl-tRNA(Gln) amidotransferase subunit A